MPIPELDDNGCLPPGVHDCSVAELKDRFGRFQGSDRRPKLIERLEAFVADAQRAAIFAEIIVDGSFVTSKPDPGDVDLLLVLQPEHDFLASLPPAHYNLVSQRRVKRRFGFDILVARSASAERTNYVELFLEVRGRPDLRKGMLRIAS